MKKFLPPGFMRFSPFLSILLALFIVFSAVLIPGAEVYTEEITRARPPEYLVRVVLNDWLIQMDVAPQIEAGRTLLPVRFISEAMEARVDWDGNSRSVKIVKDGTAIELTVDRPEALVNGWEIELDVPPRIIQGRTMVPLRFLAETLGARVSWDAWQRVVFLEYEEVPTPPRHGERVYDPDEPPEMLPEEPLEDPGAYYYEDIEVDVDTYGIRLGDDEASVRDLHGSPSWQKKTIYGYRWMVYQDTGHYLAVGIKDDSVVSLYAAGNKWHFGPVGESTEQETLKNRFTLSNTLLIEKINSYFQLNFPVLKYENTLATFYPDQLNENVITAVRLEDLDVARNRIAEFYLVRSREGSRDRVSDEQLRQAEEADERILFDLANYERSRRGLPLLRWHAAAARAALVHSREMFLQDYFNHVSEITGKGPSARLDEQGVNFSSMAENIARGQMDAIEAHHGLMNSIHHRPAILNREYHSLGVGVFGDCYTQKYVTGF